MSARIAKLACRLFWHRWVHTRELDKSDEVARVVAVCITCGAEKVLWPVQKYAGTGAYWRTSVSPERPQ